MPLVSYAPPRLDRVRQWAVFLRISFFSCYISQRYPGRAGTTVQCIAWTKTAAHHVPRLFTAGLHGKVTEFGFPAFEPVVRAIDFIYSSMRVASRSCASAVLLLQGLVNVFVDSVSAIVFGYSHMLR